MPASSQRDAAHQAIDQASADSQVAKYAPSELERASASLQKAKAAWNDKRDLTTTTHFVDIAQQRAATAQEFASEPAAMRRADAVRIALLQRAIDSGRIAIRSHGEQNPAPSNKSRIGRLENRRAEVVTGDSNTKMLRSSQISSTTSSDENGQFRQPER